MHILGMIIIILAFLLMGRRVIFVSDKTCLNRHARFQVFTAQRLMKGGRGMAVRAIKQRSS